MTTDHLKMEVQPTAETSRITNINETRGGAIQNDISFFFFTFMWPCIVTSILIIKPTRCTNFSNLFWKWNSTFRTVPLSIIRSYSLYTQQWYMSYRFVDSFRTGSGWNSFHFQNKFENSVHLDGFIIRYQHKLYVHVTVHRDMWPCIVTCDRASWQISL
jgi:hypothetical protein